MTFATAYEGDSAPLPCEKKSIPAATYVIFEVVGPMPLEWRVYFMLSWLLQRL